ncbi:MAG TPA: hypothetical protein VGQ65_24710, partial [Thermoanaerobaculia bacterium]|nr:hypothetical protein [Thermoanaerobaculia bacterium]
IGFREMGDGQHSIFLGELESYLYVDASPQFQFLWRSFRAKHFGVRWLDRHRTPKLREMCHASRKDQTSSRRVRMTGQLTIRGCASLFSFSPSS